MKSDVKSEDHGINWHLVSTELKREREQLKATIAAQEVILEEHAKEHRVAPLYYLLGHRDKTIARLQEALDAYAEAETSIDSCSKPWCGIGNSLCKEHYNMMSEARFLRELGGEDD